MEWLRVCSPGTLPAKLGSSLLSPFVIYAVLLVAHLAVPIGGTGRRYAQPRTLVPWSAYCSQASWHLPPAPANSHQALPLAPLFGGGVLRIFRHRQISGPTGCVI